MIQGQSYGWGDLLKVADEAGFTPLPIGEYDVIVASAEVKATQSGKDSIVVYFQVTTGPQQGRKIRNQFTISPDNPNAVGFFFRHMTAIGLTREYFAQTPPPTMHHVAANLVNRPCRIKVSHREWGGTMRDNVDSIMPAGVLMPQGPQVPQAPQGAPIQAAPVPSVPGTPVVNAVPAAPAAPQVPQAPAAPATPVAPAVPAPVAQPAPVAVSTPPQPGYTQPVTPTIGIDITTGDPVVNVGDAGVNLNTGQAETQVAPGVDVPSFVNEAPDLPF